MTRPVATLSAANRVVVPCRTWCVRRSGRPGAKRQYRLRAVQRLDLALFVHGQHHAHQRRTQAQPDNVAHLVHEHWVRGELDRLLPVRLQPEGVPDAQDGVLNHALLAGHQPSAPLRGASRLGPQRSRHHRPNARIIDGARYSRTRRVKLAVEPLAYEAPTPLRDGLLGHPQPFGNRVVLDGSAQARTMRAGSAAACAVLRRRASACSSLRWSSLNLSVAFDRAIVEPRCAPQGTRSDS